MHESSFAEAVNKTIEDLCKSSGWTRVIRVVLKIGQMRAVEPELFAFAFQVAAMGGVCEDAELSILEVPIAFQCRACGAQVSGTHGPAACPECGSCEMDLCSGMELTIDSIEVEGGGPDCLK